MLNGNKKALQIKNNNQINIAVDTTAVKSAPLPAGKYDIWCNVACHVLVRASRNGDGSVATIPDVTVNNGYYIPANKVIPIQIQGGDVVGILGASAGNFKMMKVGDISSMPRTETVYTLPAGNVWGPLKALLETGKDAMIFINADSTGYSDYGPFYQFPVLLGDVHDYTVIMHRWAEWDGSALTGPKQYSAPVTLRTGTRGTLRIYLAALPGQVAGTIFDGTRKPTALDALPRPDLCITHHGHNMQSFNIPTNTGNYASGIGLIVGPVGMLELQWSNVPQIVTTQNPWRDDTGYTKVYEAIKRVKTAQPEIEVIDTYAKFILANKAATLYRDNIHPSDSQANRAGAKLIADTIFTSYLNAGAATYISPAWPSLAAPSLIDNGDFLTWPGTPPTPPTGWSLSGTGTSCNKETTVKYGDAPYSMAIIPSTTVTGQTTYLQKYLSNTEMARIAGKTVNVAALVYGKATQPRPYISFGIPDFSGAIKTWVMGDLLNCRDGWMWLVACGIPVVNDPAATWKYLRIFPSFDVANPTNTDPLYVQKILVTEGPLIKGTIAA